jgi:hypothetical protein
VARRLGRPFVDFDSEIERREGKSVAQIFSEVGEPGFRALELALTKELAQKSGMILAYDLPSSEGRSSDWQDLAGTAHPAFVADCRPAGNAEKAPGGAGSRVLGGRPRD